MPAGRYTRRAENDLLAIGAYTLNRWGEAQAARYLDDLESACLMLAKNPALGRSCEEIRPGLQRSEHGRHVVFYRRAATGILISRFLHQSMLPTRRSFDPRDRRE